MATKKKLTKVSEDPAVIGYKFASNNKSGIGKRLDVLRLGKLGKAEGYNAQSINEGVNSGEIVGFLSVTEKGGLIKYIKSTGTATGDDNPIA